MLWHDDVVLWRRMDGTLASAPIGALTLAEFKRLLAQVLARPLPMS